MKIVTSKSKKAINVILHTQKTFKKENEKKLLKEFGFEAKDGQTLFLQNENTFFLGCEDFENDTLRAVFSTFAKEASKMNFKNYSFKLEDVKNISAIVEGVVLGTYSFDYYKSEKNKDKNIILHLENSSKNFSKLVNDALIVANATNYTRTLVNMAPQEMNPSDLANEAKKLAKTNSLECTILDEKEIEKEKMMSMHAVGRASIHKPRLIHLAYKPKNPSKVVTLVGKGLTYDSGGLSLKPATSMVTMKMDKAGACATLGMIKAISELGLNVEVHTFIGAAENMVDGSAYKPDDILIAKNGVSIEVRNTDAEGRLVLADVLCYAQEKVKSDYIFDFATLTGACMVALGSYTIGVMGHSSKLKHQISSTPSGEFTGSLPFNKHLKKMIKSDVADISNIGNRPYGGAITAALFLDNFIEEKNKNKWLHFDIAGPAYTESPWDCNVFGATGASVRLMSKFIKNISKEEI